MATATKNTEKKLTTSQIAARHRAGRNFLALKEQVKEIIDTNGRIQDWMDRGFIEEVTWYSVTSNLIKEEKVEGLSVVKPVTSGSFQLSIDEVLIEAKVDFLSQRLKLALKNRETGDKVPVQMVMTAEPGDDLEQLKAVIEIIKDEWSALI